MLLLSIIIYLIPSIFFCMVVFQRLHLGKWLISYFLCVFSTNILVAQLLSSLGSLNDPWSFLITEVVFCTIVSLLLAWIGHITPLAILEEFKLTSEKKDAYSYLLIGSICLIMGGFFFVGLTTPPNNIDSLRSHLPRILHWLQHGSFENWLSANWTQLYYPHNAHIQGLWLYLFSMNENLFFIVQGFSLLVIIVTVFEISRLLGFSHTQSLIGSLVLLSFPVVLLQTYSFQGDLTVSALTMTTVLLLFLYLKEKRPLLLAFTMLPLALALGTKQTAFLVLPALTIYIIYWLVTNRLPKRHASMLLLFIPFFLLFSSYKHIQNYRDTGKAFGIDIVDGTVPITFQEQATKIAYNLMRYSYQSISMDGVFDPIRRVLLAEKATLLESILAYVNIDLESDIFLQPGAESSEHFNYRNIPALNEDTTWFGPVSLILLPFSVISCFLRKDARLRDYGFFAIIWVISYTLFLAWQRPGWDPYQGRYLIQGIAPLIPLIACILPAQGKKAFWTIVFLVGVVFSLSTTTFLFNTSKPIITQRTAYNLQNRQIIPLPENNVFQSIWKSLLMKFTSGLAVLSSTRLDIYDCSYYEQLFYNNASDQDYYEFVDNIISNEDVVYLWYVKTTFEYALFDHRLARSLVYIDSISQVPINGYIIASSGSTEIFLNMILVDAYNEYTIYRVTTGSSGD